MRELPVVLVLSFVLTGTGCTSMTAVDPGSGTGTATVLTPDGVPIVYEVQGTGKPALVFIHCWSCDRTFWDQQVESFASDHTIVTLDLPGHGESGSRRTRWGVDGLAADVESVVDATGLERVILIGHSMGGPVALAAAGRMRGRVEAIVAVDTLHDVEMVWPEEEQARIIGAFESDFDGAIRQFVSMLVRHDPTGGVVQRITGRGLRTDRTAAIELMRDFGRLDLPALLAAAGVPVRAINAAPAPPIQPATANETNRRYADFQAVLIEDVGHYPQLERPDEFNERLRKIVSEFSSGND